jgi:hypothetical protein
MYEHFKCWYCCWYREILRLENDNLCKLLRDNCDSAPGTTTKVAAIKNNHLGSVCVPPGRSATLRWDTFVRLLAGAQFFHCALGKDALARGARVPGDLLGGAMASDGHDLVLAGA